VSLILRHLADGLRARLGADRWRHLRRWLRRTQHPLWLGSLGRMRPLSNQWGFDRGTPIDRYYIEAFLAEHRGAIHGCVLEVRDSGYTDRFGTGVRRIEVLDIDPSNPQATIVADLSAADTIASEQFDCFICTQTLQFILEPRAALEHVHRILRPGGVLLLTVPAVSRLNPRYGSLTDYWRFTAAACAALLEPVFGKGQVQIRSSGNVTSAIAFLAGVAWEELRVDQLDVTDDRFPVIIGACARKRPGESGTEDSANE
jgi:hypothetical protein